MTEIISRTEDTITLRVPMAFARRGGRKLILGPDGKPVDAPSKPHPDPALLKAVLRAHEWQQALDAGRHDGVRALAEAHKLNSSYVSRILRLTLLAPDLTEAILAGRQPATLQLADLLKGVPMDWAEQRARWGSPP